MTDKECRRDVVSILCMRGSLQIDDMTQRLSARISPEGVQRAVEDLSLGQIIQKDKFDRWLINPQWIHAKLGLHL